MSRAKGALKTGGRKKGTPNKSSGALMERARSLGIDPFEVLLFFAGNKWQKLGYKSADAISPELRKASAEAASQYLYPKRKAIEVTGRDGGPLDFYLTMSPEERQRRRAELEKRLKK